MATGSAYAAQQLAKKVKLEATFQREVLAWFRSIGATLRPVIRHSGEPPDVAHFRTDLIALLRKHYMRTTTAFGGEVAATLTKAWNIKQQDQQSQIGDATLAAMLAWAVNQAPQQADHIMATTQQDLQAIYDQAQAALADQQDQGNTDALAALVLAAFAASYIGRADTIATFETQSAAEHAKLVEADAAASVAGRQSVKVWHTVLDARTRFAHVLANRQEKDRREPFVVHGERLPAPGDTSMGASLSNVIHCRCSAEYRGA